MLKKLSGMVLVGMFCCSLYADPDGFEVGKTVASSSEELKKNAQYISLLDNGKRVVDELKPGMKMVVLRSDGSYSYGTYVYSTDKFLIVVTGNENFRRVKDGDVYLDTRWVTFNDNGVATVNATGLDKSLK